MSRAGADRSSRAVRIAPSILSADFAQLGSEVASVERGGADWVHVDVMDGRFVPNITIGPLIVQAVKRSTSLPLDVHLMIVEPERYAPDFVRAGASTVGVHVETCPHLHRNLAQIRECGARACVVLNPSTPAIAVEPVLGDVDQVLVMTVNPGFGGQAYIATMEPKIRELRARYDGHVEVDGGIGPDTIAGAAAAGANWLVAGSALYRDPDGLEHAVKDLRARAEAAASD